MAATVASDQSSQKTERYWYGWQVGLASGSGAVLISLGVATQRSPSEGVELLSRVFLTVGLPVFIMGAPVAHWSNQYLGKGLISIGANVAIPVTAGLVGGAVACAPSSAAAQCQLNGFWAGFAIAALIVPWVDGLVMGWGEVTLERTVNNAARNVQEVHPWVGLGRSGEAVLGLEGRF